MHYIFLFCRSIAFNMYIVLTIILYGFFYVPFFVLGLNKKIDSGQLFAKIVLFGLRYLCGISYKIEGEIPSYPCVIASKHQSALECLIFLEIFPRACFILKKELLRIPIFGSYLKALKMIIINRSNSTESIRQINEGAQNAIEANRTVIIFPEGTRVKVSDKTKCKSGIIFIAKSVIAPIVPVWLNSGKFWGKNSFIKYPGEVIIRFLDPIPKQVESRQVANYLNQLFDEQK